MPKVILLVTVPLPYLYIGSWTTMYNHYLRNTAHEIDYIICPKTDGELLKGIEYSFVNDNNLITKIKGKINQKIRWNNYLGALDKIIKPSEKYIIQIIDNSGIVISLDTHIKSKYKRTNFYIQYFYHGFPPLKANPSEDLFFNSINEMVFLTNLSYKVYLNYYTNFICRSSVLYNAIDSKQFFKLRNEDKRILKQSLGFQSKMVFVWCSQDRPKKGLQLILQVWSQIFDKYGNDVELIIIGAEREQKYLGVQFLGKIPNNQIAKYYQISDFYLFPTLCKEGFGLTLAEALKCGCYCIASNQGGVPEVLKFGKIGRLVENPNFVHEWIIAIEEGISIFLKNDYNNPYNVFVDNDLYDIDNWSNQMNSLIKGAKRALF